MSYFVQLKKSARILYLLTISCLLFNFMLFVPAAKADGNDDDDLCIKVDAYIESNAFGVEGGCDSPSGICTKGITVDKSGLLNGTSLFRIIDFRPVTELYADIEPTALAYIGLLEITTDRGVLTIRNVGIIDLAKVLNSSWNKVSAGTGVFEGAEGMLFFHGQSVAGQPLHADIEGKICWADKSLVPDKK